MELSEATFQFYSLMKDGKDSAITYQYADKKRFSGRELRIANNKYLHFANCSYLGLESDQRLIEAAYVASKEYGVLFSNSRAFISSPLYTELESLIDEIIPGYSIITTTTTLGHCGVLPLLIDKNDLIIQDIHSHNSLKMAANLCKANGTKIQTLRIHNDMNLLSSLANKSKNFKRIWFIGDGIYSMQGEFLNTAGLKDALNTIPNLYAYLDDAHGFGWTGKTGEGFIKSSTLSEHPKVIGAVSMCKAFGTSGGVITFPTKGLRDKFNLIGQTQIFSAPISNGLLGASIASAKIFLSQELQNMQKELVELIKLFKTLALENGVNLKTKSFTPIQFVEIGKAEQVRKVMIKLKNRGIFCSTAAYPSMPKNGGGIRISITRHHKKADIDQLIEALSQILNN